MKYIKWFFRVARPMTWPIAGSVLCHLLLVGCALGYVYISKALVDIATGNTAFMEYFHIAKTSSALLIAGAGMLLIIAARTFLQAGKNFLQTKATVKLRNSIRQRHFENLLRLSGDIRGKFHSGDILNRIQDDSSTVASTVCSTAPNLIGTGCQFLAAFIYLMCLESRLAWLLVVILPVGIFGGKYLMRRMRALTLEVRRNDSLVQSHVQESIQHQSLIKTLEYDESSSMILGNLHGELYDVTMKRTRFTLWSRIIMAMTMSGGYALAFLWGVAGIYHGTVTFGLMTAFLQLVGQLQRPLIQMGEELPGIFHSTASVDRLEELDALPKEKEGESILMDEVSGIRVENVDFRYDDGTELVLEGFSHDFKPGSRTAIVGPTGVGKSTLIKLMLSLTKPTKGELRIYSTSNAEGFVISPQTRCNLIYVPQGNSLFSGTIKDNLLMGKPDASTKEMEDALHTAAADFVLELPSGIDTECFESGGGLSEGQAQRIAIARALLRPGSILLLDEFSSALDPQTEETLLERLTARENGKTMIFITHREKIAEFCDNCLEIRQNQ